MQECRDENEIYNYQKIQLSNDKFINEILGGELDLTFDAKVACKQASKWSGQKRKLASEANQAWPPLVSLLQWQIQGGLPPSYF